MPSIICTADLHEHLVDIPACDLRLIAGDVSFASKGDLAAKHAYLGGDFRPWLDRISLRRSGARAGNHDQSIEAWGTPWKPWFHELGVQRAAPPWRAVPRVQVRGDSGGHRHRHGARPARGYGDRTSAGANVGSTSMAATLERVRPRLMVCGHIHEASGRYRLGETEVINASLVDARYRPVNRRPWSSSERCA
jgi:hypothetical protein